MAESDEKRRSPEIGIRGNNNTSEGGFKFNVHAAEFVPRSYAINSNSSNDGGGGGGGGFGSSSSSNNNNNNKMSSVSLSTGYFYPCVQFLQDAQSKADHHHHLVGGSPTPTLNPSSDWFYMNHSSTSPPPPPPPPSPSPFPPLNNNNTTNQPALQLYSNSGSPRYSVNDDLQQKIIKQVEYLFSDLSLIANDTMAKHVNKDPEGYVPIPIIASMKKIKAMVTDHHSLVQPLRSSTKLVMSKDNKKVKRKSPFTETYKDELQCRTVMVENLPDDHSYQNLDKIFRVVGSVKAIRLCHPPESNNSTRKNEVIISNKLHALVEYENAEIAERAVEKLNDERNWRKGMRVRVMLRRSPKSVLKNRKSDFDMLADHDDELPSPKAVANGAEFATEYNSAHGGEECSKNASGVGRGRIKTKGLRIQNDRAGFGLLSSPTHCHSIGGGCSPLHQLRVLGAGAGPRMPDGTRGFTMGRGKPLLSLSGSTPTS